MSDREPPVVLARVGGRGAGVRARIATAGLVVGLVGLVAVGAFGGGTPTTPGPDRTAGTVSTASPAASEATAPAAPAADASAAPDATQRQGRPRLVAPRGAGYAVAYPRDATHRPIIFDDGELAIFGYGERVPDGSYAGTVRVAVGTPARGASISGPQGTRQIHAESLSGLLDAYLRGSPSAPISVTGATVDGVDAALLDFAPPAAGQPASSVALVVHGGRVFVITASGFDRLYPEAVLPSAMGLADFLRQLRFTGSLFVSRALGFQVATPLGIEPEGSVGSGPDADGAYVFPDGEPTADGGHSHAISVSVGTHDHPARVQVLPPEDSEAPDFAHLGSFARPAPGRVSRRDRQPRRVQRDGAPGRRARPPGGAPPRTCRNRAGGAGRSRLHRLDDGLRPQGAGARLRGVPRGLHVP